MKRVVVLSGAGISAESGLSTFRDKGGLWEEHSVEELATPEAWERNPALVLRFYNERRRKAMAAEPNAAHRALVKLEQGFRVDIVTQNVDDLHERAGSSSVLHLHGQLNQARSSVDEGLVYPLDHWEMKLGDLCERGSPLRPNIVWFGEAVPRISDAIPLMQAADLVLVVGTSLKVYPAAGLLNFAAAKVPTYYIDPNAQRDPHTHTLEVIPQRAGEGVPDLVERLLTGGN